MRSDAGPPAEPPAPPAEAPPPAQGGLAARWPLAAALALAALFAFQRLSDMDTGWLLALGRRIAAGPFPRTNALSWTAPAHPWFPTNWLFDLGLYGAHEALGVAGVQLATLALAGAALGLAFLAARRAGASPAAASAAALLALGVLWTRLVPRPHLVQLALEALVLERCAAARARRAARPLYALPFATALWMNAHQSAPIGLALALACLLPALLGREGWARAERARAGAALAAGAAALFATPGGAAPLLDLVAHLRLADILPLQEHARPGPLGEPYLYVFGAIALGAALATRGARAWLLPTLLGTALTFGLGRRFGGDLAVLAIPATALALEAAGAGRTRARSLAAGAGALALALGLMTLGQVPLASLGGRLGASWDPDSLPVEAVERAKALGLGPRGFHAYRFGGYVAWTMPRAGDFQDGRLRAWPPEFWHELEAACSRPDWFRIYLDRWQARWALTSATPAPLSGHGLLDGAPGWRLAWADDTARLYVRAP